MQGLIYLTITFNPDNIEIDHIVGGEPTASITIYAEDATIFTNRKEKLQIAKLSQYRSV